MQSLRTTLLDDLSITSGAEGEARCRATRDGARILTDKQILLMTRSLCFNDPDRLHGHARAACCTAPAERRYVLQDDDDVDEDEDEDDDDDDVDDDDDAETDEDEAEDEEEEEETWQVSAIAPFR